MSNKIVPVKGSKEVVKHKTHGGIGELQAQVNHLFESFMNGFGIFGYGDIQKMEFSPEFDLAETEDAYDVKVELSGMDEKDVNVTLSNDVLTIYFKLLQKRSMNILSIHLPFSSILIFTFALSSFPVNASLVN